MSKATITKQVEKIVSRSKDKKDGLVGILQDIQTEFNYLPEDALTFVAEKTKSSLSQVYSLATFYKAFSLKPRGKYLVCLCMGTACHVRGSERILEELERILKIKPGQTSGDGEFSLETVNCLGACGLGPLMVINGEYFGRLTSPKLKSIFKKYKNGSSK